MIPDAPPAIRAAAAKLRYIKLLCVNMVVCREHLTDAHWFYIYDPDVDVSRVKVISNLTPNAVPPGTTALQCEIYRRGDESMDVSALQVKAARDVARILGFEPDRDVASIGSVEARHAYVISDLQRQKAVDEIVPWLRSRDIHPAGMLGAWKFIWSDAAYAAGAAVGRELSARMT